MQAHCRPHHTFHGFRGEVFFHVLHTGVLQEILQFIPSAIVGVELTQGVGGHRGADLGPCHPQRSLWLETHERAPIHSHFKEGVGSRALRRQLTAQEAANGQRNCGGGDSGSRGCVERVPGVGGVHLGGGNFRVSGWVYLKIMLAGRRRPDRRLGHGLLSSLKLLTQPSVNAGAWAPLGSGEPPAPTRPRPCVPGPSTRPLWETIPSRKPCRVLPQVPTSQATPPKRDPLTGHAPLLVY